MSSKYRTYDYVTNIITNANASTYKPYRSTKQKNGFDNKKMQPLHVKIPEAFKKNQRIMSRNDRVDLFLEGGNFSQVKHITAKNQVDRSLYKISKLQKKEEIFLPFRSQPRTNLWKTTSQTSQKLSENLIKQEYINFTSTAQTRFRNKPRQIIAQSIDEQSNERNAPQSFKSEIPNKQLQISVEKGLFIRQKTQQQTLHSIKVQEQKIYKNTADFTIGNKQNSNSQNQLKRSNKINKPLFYLDPKQVSHIRADSYIATLYPSGQTVFGNYSKKTGEIASLTKVMTFYVVIKIAENFGKDISQEKVQIDEEAQSMTGTSAQIFMGDTYTVEQLLYGLMLPSGNDAATALAQWGGAILQSNDPTLKVEGKISYVKTFVRYMNQISKKCGMKVSTFCNPHGLPHPQSCSNPQDLSILLSQCLKINVFRQVIKTKKYKCWVEHKGVKHEVIWQNTNKLLRRPYFIGGKTGVTITAGPCLVSCYEIDEQILIIVLLRTNKLSRRFKQTRFIVGLALSKLDKNKYKDRIKQVLRRDVELDSDNSDEEEQFNYDKADTKQMSKRNKILTFQM